MYVATVTDSCLYQENHFLVESRCRTELNTAVLFIISVHTATVTVSFHSGYGGVEGEVFINENCDVI